MVGIAKILRLRKILQPEVPLSLFQDFFFTKMPSMILK